jgi:hypothetical protein
MSDKEKDEKFSLEDVKKIPPKMLLRIIDKAKEFVKKDETMIEAFEEYGIDINEIDYYPMYFADLEVSAKTDHSVIFFNYKLLCDGFEAILPYMIHEVTHCIQQTTGEGPTQGANDGSYLDNKSEQEAFQNQVKFLSEHEGDNRAESYVDDLLKHHEIKGPKKKEELEEVLMEKV